MQELLNMPVVLVFDCGATNVRAIAVDRKGNIVARAAVVNASEAAAENPQWQQWSVDAIIQRFCHCSRQIAPALAGKHIVAICVTSFGVDGALVDETGELLYPVISWKCPRTTAVMEELTRRIDARELQRITGVGTFSFNTIYKLAWLQQHHADLVQRASHWLFISSLINHRLTGVFSTDITMAGTSQLLDLQTRRFSDTILRELGITDSLFPPLIQPGEQAGRLRQQMATLLGLPAGIPVISCGHDTQFALFGAGAGIGQVVLSSGTWEILMMRSQQADTELLSTCGFATCELDSEAGLYNPGMQWLASGVLERIRSLFWSPDTPWADVIAEAGHITPGCNGVRLTGDWFAGDKKSGWRGVSLASTRGHFYRAALEALALRLRDNLQQLERITGISVRELLLVGGGSRNLLWNQIKADVLQLPLRVLDDAETTVLGAAMYGWQGAGVVASASEARQQVRYQYYDYFPDPDAPPL